MVAAKIKEKQMASLYFHECSYQHMIVITYSILRRSGVHRERERGGGGGREGGRDNMEGLLTYSSRMM